MVAEESRQVDFAELDKSGSDPIWVQLRDQIIDMIRTGKLAYGQKMPTVRNLAKDLGVSVSVVNQAYRYLKVTGYLEARQGSGVRVRMRTDTVDDANFPKIAKLTDDYACACLEIGYEPEDIINALRFYFNHRKFAEENGDDYRSDYLEKLMGPPPSHYGK